VIPLTASTTEWTSAYQNRITAATYPLQLSSNTLSLAFGTTTNNTWSGLQTFSNTGTTTFAGGLSVNSNFYVQQNGWVGIGTTNPGAKLEVSGSARYSGTSVVPTANGSGDGLELWYYNGAGGPYGVILSYNRDTSAYKSLRIAGSDIGFEEGNTRIMTIDDGNVGIGTTSPYAKLSVVGEVVATNFTATSTTATSTFAGGLRAGGSTGLYVLQNGSVGVGTSSPVSKLDVVGGINFSTNSNLSQNGVIRIDGNGRYISTLGSVTNPGIQFLSDSNTGIYSPSGDTIAVSTGGSERVRISSGGNVGIGSTTPVSRLTVSGGDAWIDGLVKASHFVSTSTTATSTFSGSLFVGTTTSSLGQVVIQSGTNNLAGLAVMGNNGNSQEWYSDLGVKVLVVDSYGQINNPGAENSGQVFFNDDINVNGTYYVNGTIGVSCSNETVYSSNGIVTQCSSSDERFKENVTVLSDDTLDKISELRPVTYEWNEFYRSRNHQAEAGKRYGFIAQDLRTVFPELVNEDSQGYLSVQYAHFTAVLTKAIQELWSQVKPILAWFSMDGSQFKVQGEVCVDDVCITKEQFKELLINAGGAAAPRESDSNTDSGSSHDTQAEDNAGTTTNPVEEGSTDTGTDTDGSEPVQEDPVVTDEPEATTPTPDPVENTSELSISESDPESEPSSESTDSPTE
jgi:hypothetical protein